MFVISTKYIIKLYSKQDAFSMHGINANILVSKESHFNTINYFLHGEILEFNTCNKSEYIITFPTCNFSNFNWKHVNKSCLKQYVLEAGHFFMHKFNALNLSYEKKCDLRTTKFFSLQKF